MTISTTDSRISYNGNGVTTVFSFPYRFLANGDLVVLSVSAAGVETTKVLTTDYTLTGAGDDAGGSVTMLVAPASGTRLVIYRDTAVTQETDYISGDPFPAETHERALDRLTMIAQEIDERTGRSLNLSIASPSGIDTELPTPDALKLIGWNADADGLENFAALPSDVVVTSYMETVLAAADADEAKTLLEVAALGGAAAAGANSDITSLSGLTGDVSGPSSITGASAGMVISNVTSLNGGALEGFRNRLINGDMKIAQRIPWGVSAALWTSATVPWANNDDTYQLDRWLLLSDGNDIVDVSQNTANAPTNGLYAMALDVETINKKFGVAQIVEQLNCVDLIGNTVTLSFKAKVSSTTKLDNVKCAIVAWSGTADTVTSDIVSAWNGEGTNPTLIANATYENTPTNLNVTTSWATYSVSAAIDTASAKNIIVLIWSDVTDTTLGDFLYIADVQLEQGSIPTVFNRRSVQTEMAMCQRYFERIGFYQGSSLLAVRLMYNNDVEVHTFSNFYTYAVTKRIFPTVTLYGYGGAGPVIGTSGQVEKVASGGSGSNVAAAVNPWTQDGFTVYMNANYGAGFINIYPPANADAEM